MIYPQVEKAVEVEKLDMHTAVARLADGVFGEAGGGEKQPDLAVRLGDSTQGCPTSTTRRLAGMRQPHLDCCDGSNTTIKTAPIPIRFARSIF